MSELDHYPLLALHAIKEPILILDQNLCCVFANEAFHTFVGTPPEDRGRAPEVKQFWPDYQQVGMAFPEFASEFRTVDDKPLTVKLSLSEMGDGFRLVRVLAGMSTNDTILNFHAQRLETLGMLAGGIAHDFNNILAGVLGHITYLKTILPASGAHVESLVAIEEGAKKASSITQQILNFSKLDPAAKPQRVNVSDLLVKTCRLLRGAISPAYRLEYRIPERPVYVFAVEGNLAQVIVNLAINSRDALQPGGFIKLELDIVEERSRLEHVFNSPELIASRYACLSVSDNGHGMDEELMQRIFEPYFSTKKDKGTGLGLATVAAIARLFGGAIEVQSRLGEGTSMSLYLPVVEVVETHPNQNEGAERSQRLLGGSEKILVVDDEYPVRNVLCVSLEHLGYKVGMASSGVEALEKYAEQNANFDLVILDMLMPNLSGEKVFVRLREMNPRARVLVMSGYSLADTVRKILENEGVDFIQKPFTIEDLSKKVRDCLDYEFKR